jgi:hypothetical protein
MANKKILLLNPTLVNGVDKFRAKFGSWLPLVPGGAVEFLVKDPDDMFIREISEPTLIEPFEAVYTQTITVVSNGPIDAREGGNFVHSLRDLTSVDAPGYFHDFATSLNNPITLEEALILNTDPLDAISGVKYTYNYYDSYYEASLSMIDDADHVVIPSMYAMLDATTKVGTDEADGPVDFDVLMAPTEILVSAPDEHRHLENQIVPIENTPLIADYNGSRYLFPMYVDINIPLDENNEVAKIMEDTKMGAILTRDLEGIAGETVTVGTDLITYSTKYYTDSGTPIVTETPFVFSADAKVVDLLDWADDDAGGWSVGPTPLPTDHTFIGPATDSSERALYPDDTLAFEIGPFKTLLKGMVFDVYRDFEALNRGDLAYSETLMYKIQKYLGPDPTTADPIQTFYFMSSGEVEEFLSAQREFIFSDTQVKYNLEYTYVVTAYQAVFGAEYEYTEIGDVTGGPAGPGPGTGGVSTPFECDITVEIRPLIKLVEVGLFMSTGRILDNPPLQPDMKFFPIKGDPNKIKIFFTSATGNEDVEPVALTEEEEADVSQIATNQNRNDGKITFKSDDHASAFQIYRVAEPPIVIEDFANKLIAEVSTTTTDTAGITITASSVTAFITQAPNQKYYYIFRTVDAHGGLSNPSTVYEIELYNDGGVGYPIIRHFEFGSIEPKTPTKSARKIIQILPRMSQVFLNEEASGLIGSDGLASAAGHTPMVLGLEDESLIGKAFKIRLISKSTGKKLDINVDFKQKRIRSSIE